MSPTTGQFDIYQSAVGVTAVTSPVQRQILAALRERDLQLPELVQLTGKAKSTLSSIHMKELLNRELIDVRPHPEDSRRKVYRLIGEPMGSSGRAGGRAGPNDQGAAPATRNPPNVAAPDSAMRHSSPLTAGVALQIIAAAPHEHLEVLDAQAAALGKLYAHVVPGTEPRAFAHAYTRFLENERLAEHLQLDFEQIRFRCRPGQAVQSIPPEVLGRLLAAFSRGILAQNNVELELAAHSDGQIFELHATRS